MSADFDCIIIGAGLAGLSAAKTLNSYLNGEPIQTLVIEASDRLGGKVSSDYLDGFTLDRGFQVINPSYLEIRRLQALAGLDFHPVKAGFIDWQNNHKFRVLDLVGSSLGNIGEKISFLRFLSSPELSGSFEKYSAKFPNLYSRFIRNFFTGVYLTEPNEISAQINQEVTRSFVRSYVTRKLPGLPTGGVQKLASNLSKGAGAILINEPVRKISRNQIFTDRNRYRFKHLIVATDYQNAKKFIPKLPTLKFNGSITYYFSAPKISSEQNLLVVNGNNGLINSGVISNFNPNYAPHGKSLISATFLTSGKTNLKSVQQQLSKIWKVPARELDMLKRYQIPRSLPKFSTSKLINSNQISEEIFLAGDYLVAPSQQGAMKSGRLAAEAVIKSLKAI